MTRDDYAIVGASPLADFETIHRAYRRRAKKIHSDLHPSSPHATARMTELNLAYARLRERHAGAEAADNRPSARERPPERPRRAAEQPRTFVVSKHGAGHFRTIGDAIRRAGAAGGRIVVGPGRYVESMIVRYPISIVGEGGRGQVVIEGERGPCLWVDLGDAVGRVEVSGVSLHGQADHAVCLERGACRLEECDLTAAGERPIVCVYGHDRGRVLARCRIYGGPAGGVQSLEQSQLRLDECELVGNVPWQVMVGERSELELRGSTIRDADGLGLAARDAARADVEGCRISGHTLPQVMASDRSRLDLRDSQVRDGRSVGVLLTDDSRTEIARCEIAGHGQRDLAGTATAEVSTRDCRIERDGRDDVAAEPDRPAAPEGAGAASATGRGSPWGGLAWLARALALVLGPGDAGSGRRRPVVAAIALATAGALLVGGLAPGARESEEGVLAARAFATRVAPTPTPRTRPAPARARSEIGDPDQHQ